MERTSGVNSRRFLCRDTHEELRGAVRLYISFHCVNLLWSIVGVIESRGVGNTIYRLSCEV
jgi:hypothetical protein